MTLGTKNTLEEVVVTSRRSARQESIAGLLSTQKNAAVVSDGIPAELIRRTPDRNTSDVLKRVSGVAIQDNKFAVVRGLNDRYNAALLNGAPLPSSENDRKAFAFDIFPANMLDNLVILKTASPDQTGEFAGGTINITTNSIPAKNFTSISFGTGINTITTFKDGLTYQGGKRDWLGLDDGTRALPSGIPAPRDFPTSPSERAIVAQNFTNNTWGINTRTVSPNFGFQVSSGFNVKNKKGADMLGVLLSASYNRSFVFYDGVLRNYEYNRDNPSEPPIWRGDFENGNHSVQTLSGLIANLSFKINNNNKIHFKNIVSINSEDRTFNRPGRPDQAGDPNFFVNATALWFTSNIINSHQLYGEHNLPKSQFKVNWLLGYSGVQREMPDLRQMNYGKPEGAEEFSAIIPSATVSANNGGTRFYSTTDEYIYNGKVDIARILGKGSNFETNLKFGGAFQFRDRVFDARLVGFGVFNPPGSRFNRDLLRLPQDQIFDPANLGRLPNGQGGFLLLDGTIPTFAYDATSVLGAAYIMGDSRVGEKLRLIYGVRYENFNQKLNSFLDFQNKIAINTTKGDFLPSLNAVYSINKKQNLRFAYGRTLNRPEFRELAPFAFFDFANNIVVTGNPDLQRATIDNFDVRYEVYPGRGQLLSASLFFKDFTNPIELTSDPNNFSSSLYQNALDARNFGVELEFRTLLSTLFGTAENGFLDRLTLSANAAYILSEVNEAPFAGVVKGVEERPLQGQSPYVINSSLSYNDNVRGISATLAANRVGQRIFIVGSINEPDTWEQGRTVLDFQVAKTFLKQKMEVKLNVKDILRQDLIFFLDENQNNRWDKNSDLIFQTRTFGQVISLNVSYRF
jgi:TonB-dependent receptor